MDNIITGIGIDIVSIPRIEKIYETHKNKFLNKIFTEDEINEAKRRGHFILSIAGKFAAKEAFIKASINPLNFKKIEVLSDKNNKPYISLLNLNNKKTKRQLCKCYLSISHEQEIAIAVVILLN